MADKKKNSGCLGTILLLLLVGFVSTMMIDFDASDMDKRNWSTSDPSASYGNITRPSDYTTGYSNAVETTRPSQTTQTTTAATTQGGSGNTEYTAEQSGSLFFNQLSPREQEVYNDLLTGADTGELEFLFEDIDYSSFDKLYDAFLYEHPEYFWLSGSYTYGARNGSDLKVTLKTYDFWTYSNDRRKYVDELNEKVAEIVSGAAHCQTDYDKVKYVHDYLITNAEYDHFAAEDNDNTIMQPSTQQAMSAYGAIVNGKCICGGYSEAFYLLTNALGVNSYYVRGDAGGPHAWNYLEIDGQYYFMDVTWDDPDDENFPKGVMYNYFCVSEDEISVNHTPDIAFDLPACNGTEYNYYRHNNFYFTTYSFNKVAAALEAQYGQQMVSVKFATDSAYQAAYRDLIENSKAFDIDYLAGADRTITRSCNEDMNTITFYIDY